MAQRTTVAAVGVALLLSGSGAGAQSPSTAEQSAATAPSFALKASSTWAKQIDEALAKVAQRIQFLVPSRLTPEAFVESLCAARVDTGKLEVSQSEQQPGRFEIKMPPCVQARRNVRVRVADGDTVERLALVSGLPAGKAGTYEVIPAEGTTPQKPSAAPLKAGDTVVFPEVPVWTNVVANPEVAGSRDAIVRAIADELKCRTADAEACLRQNGVELLNRAAVPVKSVVPKGVDSSLHEVTLEAPRRTAEVIEVSAVPVPARTMTMETASAERAAAERRERAERAARALPAVPPGGAARGRAATPAPPQVEMRARSGGGAPAPRPMSAPTAVVVDPPAIVTPPPPPPAPPLPDTNASSTVPGAAAAAIDSEPPLNSALPVAADQWPYDVELLARILAEAGPKLQPTVIGIADGGLADKLGGPLAGSAYAETIERRSVNDLPRDEPNNEDDDENRFVDDLLGAGVPRNPLVQSLSGSGNVSLCESAQPDYKEWPILARIVASHGTAVSAIASARRVRELNAKLGAFLPQLMFFRMVGEACDSQATFGVGDGDIRQGYDYLIAQRADVISISYKIDKQVGANFAPRVKESLLDSNALLFLPAGNHTPGNLDKTTVCPACLGNSKHSADAWKWTVVVGAATRELRRAKTSNFGEQTVGLFAPGDPIDAIDILGQPLPADDGATSYATPYAALAAALIRSYGKPNGPRDVRDRLEAATWPLDDPDSGTARNYVGVVDLVKAAAVKHHAVEVKVQEADGTWVRRTYVGKLSQPLKELAFCKGNPFTEQSYHAIRISEPRESGGRTVRLYPRTINGEAGRRVPGDFSNECQPSGVLRMKTIDGKDEIFMLSRVTYVHTTW